MSELVVPCLGKRFRLGSLYDCRTDTLLDEALWDENSIENVQTKLEESETVEIIAANSLGDKMKVLGFNPGLRLKMLSGGLSDSSVSGPIVSFLREELPPIDLARIHLRYAKMLNSEEVDSNKIIVQSSNPSKQATHVVFKVQHGTDALFTFDCPVKADETRAEVQSHMKGIMESLKHSILANSENKPQDVALALDGEQAQKYECKYYHHESEVSSPKSPKTLNDVIEVCRDYPLNLSDKMTSTGNAKLVWLFPLSQLYNTCQPATNIYNVSEAIARNAQEVLEHIDKQNSKVSELIGSHQNVLVKLKSLNSHLHNFQRLVTLFGSDIKKRIHCRLPEVCSGNISEKELMENIDQTPFQPKCLSNWLDQKRKEIEVFSAIVSNELSQLGIEFMETIPQSDEEIDTVIYFVCNVPENDVFLDAMEKHINQQGNWQQQLKSRSDEHLTLVSESFDLFKAYAVSNKDKRSIKFVVVDHHYAYSSESSTIILSRSGKRHAIQLPSKPSAPRLNPESATLTRNSVELRWTKPNRGSENIQFYNVFCCQKPTIPNQTSDWICHRTTDSNKHITIGSLDSKTKYTFKICPVLQQAPDMKCVESEHVEIDVASVICQDETLVADVDGRNICQPGKPRANDKTPNKITLEWSKPKYGREEVDMYIVSYRLQEETGRDWKNIRPENDLEPGPDNVERMTIGEDLIPFEINQKYIFKVEPLCLNDPDLEIEESEESDPIEIVPKCQPGKPTAVGKTHDSIKLEWSKPKYGSDSVEFYIVHYRKNDEERMTNRINIPGSQESLIVKDLDLNVQYVFKVTPLCKPGIKGLSSEESEPISTEQTCQTSIPRKLNATHNSITITWDKPVHGSDHISFYYVYYHQSDKPEDKPKVLTTEHTATSLKISNLEVGAKYVFWIKPDCTAIEAIDSDISAEIETKLTCQPGKPVAISESVTHNSVCLKWDKPEYDHENVELYTISYSNSSSKFSKWSKQRTSKPQESIEIKDLAVGEKYMFKVEAICGDKGSNTAESDPSDIIETMATSKPGKPTCSNEKHNAVTVKWTHPECGQENIQSYSVVISLMDDCSVSASCTPNTKVTVPFPVYFYNVTGLNPNSKYCFKVIPECRTGLGTESDYSDPVKTSQACQTGKPVAQKVLHDSIVLNWTRPEYRSDQIKNYRVLCYSHPEAKLIKELKTTETSILVPKLLLDTEYVFKVVPVCTISGVIPVNSDDSTKIKTRAASVPHAIKSGTVTHDSIQLKWSKPKYRVHNPPILSYCVSYQATGSGAEWKNMNTVTQSTTVHSLKAGMKYSFKVCAVYDDEAYIGTESDVVTIETKPSCKPGELLATEIKSNSIQLQWSKPTHFANNVQYYSVSYHTLSAPGQWKHYQTTCRTNELMVKHLEINTGYVFKVEPTCKSNKAVTQSTQSDTIFTNATSKPGTPTAKSVYYNSVDLEWEMPHDGSENINSYIIYYQSTVARESDASKNWHQQESDGCQTAMTVSGLSLKTPYIFKVLPKCNMDKVGSESDKSCPFTTKATSPPSKPEFTETTHDSVSLRWKRPEFGGIGIKDYTILYSSDGGKSFESMVTPQEYVTVANLSTRTRYIFRIVPNCSETSLVGSESENSDPIETKPSCKTGVPEASIITHESVVLKWTRPNFRSDTIKLYQISYWNIDNPDNVSECTSDGPQESVTIHGLYLNTSYKFEVTPCCADSEVGTETTVSTVITTKATSKPGTPFATTITHNTIEINWQKPDHGSELIKSYTVSCRLKHSNSKKWVALKTDGQHESITFENLELNQKYVFKVKSECTHGELQGSESDISDTVVTRATSPPGKPFAIVANLTHNSVQIRWSPPESGIDNVSAYTVSYHSKSDLGTGWKTQRCSQTTLTITELKINASYVFKIKPICKHGLSGSEGNPSDWIETKATSKPGTPQVISTTDDSVKIIWSEPECGSENIKSYIVYFHIPDSNSRSVTWQQCNSTRDHYCNATVGGLILNTQYVFKVIPVCISGIGSYSDTSNSCWTNATSQPGIPEAIHVTHDTIQLRWSKPMNGSENVAHYVISCRVEGGPQEDWNKTELRTNGATEHVIVSKLAVGRSYTFTVRTKCLTESAKGMESDCQSIKTKLTSPPGKPKADSKGITHSTISLEWTKPQIGSDYITYYSLHYKLFDTPQDQWLGSIRTSNDSTVITVSQLTPQTKYVFKVEPVCDTDMGSESECSNAIVTKPSSKPGKPVVKFVTHNSVSLEWDKPKYGSEYIENYTVVFHTTTQPAKTQERKGTKDCFLQVCDLSLGTQYVFLVRPDFKTGTVADCGEPSDPVETKAISQPGKPESDFVTHDSVRVRWTEPVYGKNNISHYSLQYRQPKGSDWVPLSQKIKCTTTQETISNLTHGEKYEFKILAVCKEGEGSESETSAAVETKATSPLSRPSPGALSHNSVQLKWTKPKIGACDIVRYLVLYQISDNASEEWTQKHTSGIQETILIDNLNMNTKYDIYVEPECQTGVGSKSEIISIKTKATSPPGKPTASLILHNEIHLQWTKPDYGSQNISSYTLSYRSTDKQGQWINTQLQNVESTIVDGLKVGTRYEFKLLPRCKNDNGTESEISDPIETNVTSKPGTPEAYDIVHNRLNLRWNKPGYGGSLVIGYIICYKEERLDSNWKQQECDINDTVVGGLTPGKKYIFKIQPKCTTGKGTLSDISNPVETRSTSPPSKPAVSQSNGSITHDSIAIHWTGPKHGAGNVTGYTIHYCLRDDSPDNWKTCRVHCRGVARIMRKGGLNPYRAKRAENLGCHAH